jgi:riboflavin synthase
VFTGLITAIGRVSRVQRDAHGLELTLASPYEGLEPGESVAVDGACLTVQSLDPAGFTVHVVATSLDRTTFGAHAAGRRVNLERALRIGDRLGGHIVQGHVDGIGDVLSVTERDDTRLLDLRVPTGVARVTVPLGSITVDGVSLTVNAMPAPDVIQIALIPFTLQHTNLAERRAGDRVHVEGDALGKYVNGLLAPHLARLQETGTGGRTTA